MSFDFDDDFFDGEDFSLIFAIIFAIFRIDLLLSAIQLLILI